MITHHPSRQAVGDNKSICLTVMILMCDKASALWLFEVCVAFSRQQFGFVAEALCCPRPVTVLLQ